VPGGDVLADGVALIAVHVAFAFIKVEEKDIPERWCKPVIINSESSCCLDPAALEVLGVLCHHTITIRIWFTPHAVGPPANARTQNWQSVSLPEPSIVVHGYAANGTKVRI
jgi:hypothetical protein